MRQGEAGVFVPDEGYLRKAHEICKKYNVLLIADEVAAQPAPASCARFPQRCLNADSGPRPFAALQSAPAPHQP